MDTTSYAYNGKSWRLSPTTSDCNSFFHSAFGAKIDQNGAYFDRQASFRRVQWGAFLVYFQNENMPSCLEDILKKCLLANKKYQQVSIDDKHNLMKYISDIMAAQGAVTVEEIPILATLENVKIVVLSDAMPDPVMVIEPNPNILRNYPNEVPKAKPREVIMCIQGDIFSRLEPVIEGDIVKLRTDSNRYKKGGSAGSKGVEYQVHLTVLVILNALKNALNEWKLSTENEEAGKFDDVVLEWSEGAVLIQSKHKESNKKRITLEDLTSTNSKNDDFSLPKYLLSYLQIKEKFNMKNIIICSNAEVHEKTLNWLNRQEANSDSLLHHADGGCTFYTLSDKLLPDLKEKTIRYYQQNFKNKGLEESLITDENLKEFSKRLHIYFNYVSLKSLEMIIEKSLSLTKFCSNSQAKITSLEIFSRVMKWFQQKDGLYFTEIRVKAMFAEIWREKYCQKLENYKVTLHKNNLNLQGSKRIIHITTSCGHLLQAIKVIQTLQYEIKKTLIVNPDDDIDTQKLILEAFGLPQYVFLIIIQRDVIKQSTMTKVYIKLKDMLDKNNYKKVIFITPCNGTYTRHIGCSESDYEIVDGSVKFEDISRRSQEMLIEKEHLLFQGKNICLKELLSGHTTKDYLKAVDTEILEKIVMEEEVRVGTRLLGLEENTARFYVNRTFKSTIGEIDENNIYDLNQKVVLISDNAGMGKSTVLSKLAIIIKERNPHLWVIKIELTDYTSLLRQLVINHEETISVVELLNSKNATKLTNHLEEFVFSMDKKVVLMLDGIDEISPDYTQLAFSLLSQCRQAVNIAKLFVTTRPHLVQRLEKELEVNAFEMQPFTEYNQVDFLTNYWAHNLKLKEDTKGKCKLYSSKLISKMSSWTKYYYDNQQDFTAIPLQLIMLAEVFQESIKQNVSSNWEGCKEFLQEARVEPKLPERIKIKELYDMFIAIKRDIFIYKANPIGNSAANMALTKQFVESLNYHKRLALEAILKEEHYKLFSSYEGSYYDEENTLKIGIVQKTNDKLHFSHRTFAEYFVAESVFDELQVQSHNPNVDFQMFCIDNVLLRPEYQIIRAFLDNFLQEYVNSIPLDIFKTYHDYDLSVIGNLYLIHILAEEGCVAILQLILKCINFTSAKGKNTFFPLQNNNIVHLLKQQKMPVNTLSALRFVLQKAGFAITNSFYGHTPLQGATTKGHLEMVKYLIELGADVNAVDQGLPLLHMAAKIGHVDIVKYIVEHGGDINIKTRKGHTPLHYAATKGDLSCVKYLIKSGDDVNICDVDGRRALHFATVGGQSNEPMEFAGMQMYFHDKTPLDLATRKNQLVVIAFIMQLGNDVNVRDYYDNTALHFAASSGILDWVKFLHESGADINIRNNLEMTALHEAANKGRLDVVKYLIEFSEDVNIKRNDGSTSLHLAASDGHLDTVKFLREMGADINIRNNKGKIALHSAIRRGHLNVVKFLCELSSDINIGDGQGKTALHIAAKRNQLVIVEYLHEIGADINIRDCRGKMAHHLAAENGCLDCVKYLIKCSDDVNVTDFDGRTVIHLILCRWKRIGLTRFPALDVNMNIRDNNGQTPLHIATKTGNLSAVKYLIKYSDDVNIKDIYGWTALHLAVWNNHIDIVQLLLDTMNINITIKNNRGKTALHLAAEKGHLDCVKYLTKFSEGINMKDNEGCTPLLAAANNGHLDTVQFLHELGADTNIRDSNGKTALYLAAEMGNRDIVKYLKQFSDVNVKNKHGQAVVHSAVINCHLDMVKFLHEHGADINIRNYEGMTALHLAAERGHLDSVKYLIKFADDVNIKTFKGFTVLHLAALKGHLEMVKYLQGLGVHLNTIDKDCRTAIGYADYYNNFEIVEFLLEMDADPSIRDIFGNPQLRR